MSTENKQKASELIKEFNSKSLSMLKINYMIEDFSELSSEDRTHFLMFFFAHSDNKIVLSNKMIFLSILIKKATSLNRLLMD